MRPESLPAYPSAGRSPVNLAFCALLLSFLGWTILERWSLGAGHGLMPHLINTLACAPVMACSLRRFRAACPRHMRARARPQGSLRAAAPALAALFVLGAGFGAALGSGSVTLVLLFALLCCCVPWTRIRAHQQHLLLSFVAVALGAGLAAARPGSAPRLLVALPAAWCLLTCAAMLCIALCAGELLKKKHGR